MGSPDTDCWATLGVAAPIQNSNTVKTIGTPDDGKRESKHPTDGLMNAVGETAGNRISRYQDERTYTLVFRPNQIAHDGRSHLGRSLVQTPPRDPSSEPLSRKDPERRPSPRRWNEHMFICANHLRRLGSLFPNVKVALMLVRDDAKSPGPAFLSAATLVY